MKRLLLSKNTLFLLLTFLFMGSIVAEAQVLDLQNRLDIVLNDGTAVTLYGKAKTRSNAFTGEYYYLPVNLHLSSRPDGVPEFLFTKYTTEETSDVGGVQGGLMHFLMEWGLSPAQLSELEARVKQKILALAEAGNRKYSNIKEPTIMGAVEVAPEGEKSFRIISATLNDDSSAKVVASGKAPVLPGGKAAVAGKLEKYSAQLLASTLEKTSSIADVSIELAFKYEVLMPAVDGIITVDWSKVKEVYESFSSQYSKKESKDNTRYSYAEVQSIYEKAIESKAVNIQIDKTTSGDESVDMIIENFMNVFISSLTDRDMDAPPAPAASSDSGDKKPNTKKGNSYKYNAYKAEKRIQRGREVYRLNYRISVPKYITLTGNLASWYDGVRDNPSCVSSVNLNDPFFQHRRINFILDLDAKEMFDEAINYVTIDVRKKRDSGNDFSDRITIDKKFISEKGITGSLTYARGEDTNADVYQYRTQWSLRGGNVYPQDSPWIQGEWEGITLAPPVKPRTIEIESDLDELKDAKISRITAQVRYMQFGEEKETNIHVSPAKGEPLVEQKIFIDKNTKGYVYRLILNHKEDGKLVLPWEPMINDDYIFTTLPEELQDKESEVYIEAKEEGNQLLTKAKDKVMTKFNQLFE